MTSPIRVRIKNFQSIEELEFDISGFTTITGKTNIGKSAIIRAITSALLNNSVIGMVRQGAPHATVEIWFNDNHIKWEKAEKGLNRYTINGVLYDKVGGKQLQQIADLGFKSVKVGSDEVYPWFAPQFFPIFLLDKAGTQVTDFICEVSRLNVLQDAVVLSNRGKKSLNEEQNKLEKDLKESQLITEKLESVETVRDLYKDILEQEASIKNYHQNITALQKLVAEFSHSADKINKLSGIESIKIPDQHYSDEIKKCNTAKNLNSKLGAIAKSIIAIKSVGSVALPQDIKEIDQFKAMQKYSWIPKGLESIRRLELAQSVSIPGVDLNDLIKYKALVKAEHLQNRIKAFETQIGVPNDLSVELKNLKNGQSMLEKLLRTVDECKALKASLSKVSDELAVIEQEISEIPVCPSCSRPGSAKHHHMSESAHTP